MKDVPFYHIYILHCSDGSYYVGLTSNLEIRLKEHQSGRGTFYTSRRLPVKLVYSETFRTRTTAEDRELQLKSWSRAKKQTLISGDLALLRNLSKSRD